MITTSRNLHGRETTANSKKRTPSSDGSERFAIELDRAQCHRIGLWSAIGISITAAASLDCKNPIKRNRRRHRNLMISLCPQPALGIVHAKQKIWRDNHLVGGCGRAECVNAIEIRISGFLVLFCSAESVH